MKLSLLQQQLCRTVKILRENEGYEELYEKRDSFRAECLKVMMLDGKYQSALMPAITSAFRIVCATHQKQTVDNLHIILNDKSNKFPYPSSFCVLCPCMLLVLVCCIASIIFLTVGM